MSNVLFIQGMGITVFLLLYFSNNLDKEHVFLKLASNLFAVSMILVIPAFLINSGLSLAIDPNLQGLLSAFYNVFVGFIVVLWGYVFVYLNYYMWIKKILVKYKKLKK